VIICHGGAEHIQRYEHVANFLNNNGFIALGMDHQGHGMSDGERCYVEKYDDYIDDFCMFCEKVKSEYAELPLFVLGHSMGGLIASITAYRYPNLFNGGVILSGPWFGPNKGTKPDISIPIVRWTLETISVYLPKWRMVEINNQALSHEPSVFYRTQRDPLHYKGHLTIRMGSELLRAAEDIRKDFNKIEYPFYIFGGEDDIVSDAQFFEKFYQLAKTPTKLKQRHSFPGVMHEALNETEEKRKEIFQKILEWLLMRCEQLGEN